MNPWLIAVGNPILKPSFVGIPTQVIQRAVRRNQRAKVIRPVALALGKKSVS